MIKITPNFNFGGNCAEALELYKTAFGAEIKALLRYSDADPADYPRELTEAERRRVYHSEVYIGSQRLMLSDNLDIPFCPGTALSLTVTMDSPDEVKRAFGALCGGGRIIYPLHSSTYSSCQFSLVDKFGFRWVVMTEND